MKEYGIKFIYSICCDLSRRIGLFSTWSNEHVPFFFLSFFLQYQEDEAPPRPPLPQLYSTDDNPPAVPPLPKEATVIRHTSVRGLKRQSDERKRDRELGQYINGDYRVSIPSQVE